jgi:hypothetical protein
MSVDFDILKWPGARDMTFPIAYDVAPQKTAPIEWEGIKSYLLDLGARESGDANSLRLNLSNEDLLEFRSSPSKEDPDRHFGIYIVCRARWTHVLGIYRHARAIDPDLVLFDAQEGMFHDPQSFEALAIAQQEFQDDQNAQL